MTGSALSRAERALERAYPGLPARVDLARAACSSPGVDRGLWHGRDADNSRSARTARAKAWCATCQDREKCLEAALANREEYGVWGGLDTAERSKLAKRRKAAS
jgi:WhiB family redox-sensing transcriptional regulator